LDPTLSAMFSSKSHRNTLICQPQYELTSLHGFIG
jgi:hypothetical protein